MHNPGHLLRVVVVEGFVRCPPLVEVRMWLLKSISSIVLFFIGLLWLVGHDYFR